MAFGLAGAYDRDLEEECAKSELSLIRHNMLLRRLVIRYFKALILYIWTALILFAVTALLKTPWDKLIVVQIGLLVWSSLTPYWVRAPVRWIFREFEQGAPDDTRDPHLVNFERAVAWSCLIATIAGIWFLWVPLQQPLAILAVPGLILNVAVMLRSYHLLTSKLRWI